MTKNIKEKLESLKKKYSVDIEEKKPILLIKNNLESVYHIRNYKDNTSITFLVRNENDIDKLQNLFDINPYLYNDYLAIQTNDSIQIALFPISFRGYRSFDREEYENTNILSLKMFYKKNELDICIKYSNEHSFISKYIQLIKSIRLRLRENPLILEIKGLKKISDEGIETDTRNIINSILFDIEYTYGYGFETVSIDSLTRILHRKVNTFPEIPSDTINLVYKKYIPELIEYFHIAEKVDYLPFKFICYYHIIEYFSDKSAYHVVAEYIKKLILKPDFHTKSNQYVAQAINIFKKENDRYTTDKIKIERVLQQFLDKEELIKQLASKGISEHFEQEVELKCSKPLKLPKIDLKNDSSFFQNLTKRIYSLRCSIVHSNPEFDDTKAIPFTPTQTNLEILKVEIELVYEIAKTIIVESKE